MVTQNPVPMQVNMATAVVSSETLQMDKVGKGMKQVQAHQVHVGQDPLGYTQKEVMNWGRWKV